MRKLMLVLLLVLLPSLVLGAGAERMDKVLYQGGSSPTPTSDRGSAWIQYDNDTWNFPWNGPFYMCNMFFPTYVSWYPFQVDKVQLLYRMIDGYTTGSRLVNRVRVFNAALSPVTEWVNVAATPGVWQTVTAVTPPTMNFPDPFYAGGWNTNAGPGELPWQGAVDPTQWPPPYWPATNTEPWIEISGPATSAATTGWGTARSPWPTTTSVASFRVEVSGATVPVELCELQGRVRQGYIVLNWSTASEEDNLGFNIYRSDTAEGVYARINDELIPGHGTTLQPQNYVFADYQVETSHTYYYKVEDVAADGSTLFHGPVAVPTGANFASSWGQIKAEFK